MNIQDYKDEILDDLLEEAVYHKGESLESFRDSMWICDNVTGNASGSYTFNAYQAEENLKDLIFSDELLEMFQEFGYDRVPLEEGPENIDVSIRCFLLDSVISENEDEIREILESEE